MEIKSKWREHPLTKQGVVELVSTDWLYSIYGTDVTPEADLMDGSIVDMETLWQNILEEGLFDPLIVRVGIKNKKYRLESGNHRIQVFHNNNVPALPATVEVTELCGPDALHIMTNASHNFDFDDNVIEENLKLGHMKPSDVFRNLK